jgi:uncharacterized protein YcbX
VPERRVVVGRVVALYRYPVKSMSGEEIQRTAVSWTGIVSDRRYAFIRADYQGAFPWLTGREVPDLLRYQPYFSSQERPDISPVHVRTPEGHELPIRSDELRRELEARYSGPVHVLHLGRGAYDMLPISLLSTATLATLGAAAGRVLDPRRLRPNVLVEPVRMVSYPEDEWRGGVLVFGEREDSAHVRVTDRIPRCVMINIDPESSERDPAVLKATGLAHDGCAGVHATVEAPGTITAGDSIYLVVKG